ncbi:hypothetical protein ABK040_001483 [Willaertia magna]
MKAKQEGKVFILSFIEEFLSELEIKLLSLSHSNTVRSDTSLLFDQNEGEDIDEAVDLEILILLNRMVSYFEQHLISDNLKVVEFNILDRTNLLKRLFICLVYYNKKTSSFYSVDILLQFFQLMNVIFQFYFTNEKKKNNTNELATSVSIQNDLDVKNEYNLLLSIIVFMKSFLLKLNDTLGGKFCVCFDLFVNSIYSIECLRFKEQEMPNYKNTIIIPFIINILQFLNDLFIGRQVNISKILLQEAINCLMKITNSSKLTRELLNTYYKNLLNNILMKITNNHSLFDHTLINRTEKKRCLFQFFHIYTICNYLTLFKNLVFVNYFNVFQGIMFNYWTCGEIVTTLEVEYCIEPFQIVYYISLTDDKQVNDLESLFFNEEMLHLYLKGFKFWLSQPFKHCLSDFYCLLIEILFDWFNIFIDHLIVTACVRKVVNYILSDSSFLSRYILPLLDEGNQRLNESIIKLFSFMQCSLNSNDITKIHYLSDYLSDNVMKPFINGQLGFTKEKEQQIANHLMKEKRILPLLVDNNYLMLMSERITIDSNTMQILKKLEKEMSKMRFALSNMLDYKTKKVLSLIESGETLDALEKQ